MSANEHEVSKERDDEALKENCSTPPPKTLRKGIHYTELPEADPGQSLGEEWNTYRREVGRLLAEGHEGRHVLIKGDQVIGLYDTDARAAEEGARRYLLEPYFVHPVRAEEPYLRIRGINYPWPTFRLQLPPQA